MSASDDPARADRHPSIAFAGDGTLFAAWDSKELKESGVNPDVRYASYDGTKWSAATPLAHEPAAMSMWPRIAAEGTGVRVVWHDSRSSDWRWSIWTATVTPNGPSPARRLTGAGNALYASLSDGRVSFTSDRRAARPQRDPTQGVFVLPVR
jgi:hypothetical protein